MQTGNERRIEFYKNILRKAVDLKRSIINTEGADVYERENLYLLAFMGLIREGYPMEIRKDEISESIQDDRPDEVFTETKITFLIDGNGYECTFTRLEEMFGSEFRSLVEEKTEYHNDLFGEEENDEVIMPDITFTEKKDYGLDDEDDDKPLDLETLPIIQNDDRYPDDEPFVKSYDTFLSNKHLAEVTAKDHAKPITYTFHVYPINMSTEDALICEIAVGLITSDNRYRYAMSPISETKSKNASIKIDGIEFMVRGSWKNGEFLSRVDVVENEKEYTIKMRKGIHVAPSVRTSSFYMRVKSERGEILNILPLGRLYNNEETGIAPAIAIFENGKERVLLSQDSEGKLPLFFGGSQKDIIIYWTGNVLKCDVVETADKQFYS